MLDYTCTEEASGSGLASCAGTVANGQPVNTAEVGTQTFVAEAADEAGNTATFSHTYTVAYDFKGFFPPVKNDHSFNHAKAGRTIPLKWRLLDADGQPSRISPTSR